MEGESGFSQRLTFDEDQIVLRHHRQSVPAYFSRGMLDGFDAELVKALDDMHFKQASEISFEAFERGLEHSSKKENAKTFSFLAAYLMDEFQNEDGKSVGIHVLEAMRSRATIPLTNARCFIWGLLKALRMLPYKPYKTLYRCGPYPIQNNGKDFTWGVFPTTTTKIELAEKYCPENGVLYELQDVSGHDVSIMSGSEEGTEVIIEPGSVFTIVNAVDNVEGKRYSQKVCLKLSSDRQSHYFSEKIPQKPAEEDILVKCVDGYVRTTREQRLKEFADKRDANAALEYANICKKNKNMGEAVEYWRKAVEFGSSPKAALEIYKWFDYCKLTGEPCDVGEMEAQNMLTSSAKGDEIEAQYILAEQKLEELIRENGKVTSNDDNPSEKSELDKFLRTIKTAHRHEVMEASMFLAEAYINGENGVERSFSEAKSYLESFAEDASEERQKSIFAEDARAYLSALKIDGLGVVQERDKGLAELKELCEKRNPVALYLTAVRELNVTDTISQELKEGVKLLEEMMKKPPVTHNTKALLQKAKLELGVYKLNRGELDEAEQTLKDIFETCGEANWCFYFYNVREFGFNDEREKENRVYLRNALRLKHPEAVKFVGMWFDHLTDNFHHACVEFNRRCDIFEIENGKLQKLVDAYIMNKDPKERKEIKSEMLEQRRKVIETVEIGRNTFKLIEEAFSPLKSFTDDLGEFADRMKEEEKIYDEKKKKIYSDWWSPAKLPKFTWVKLVNSQKKKRKPWERKWRKNKKKRWY